MQKSIWSRELSVLAELLREARENAGLSQVKLAELLDEPQPFVSRYESAERRLDLPELRQVCKALGISLGDLVTRFEERVDAGFHPSKPRSPQGREGGPRDRRM